MSENQEETSRIFNSPCAPTCPGNLKWAIPAGVLNALWNEVLPRLAAWAWAPQNTIVGGGHYFEYLNGQPDPVQAFREHMGYWAHGNPENPFPAPPGAGPPPDPQLPLNPLAHRRFEAVKNYLDIQACRIPIRFVPGGGYDFLLSDKGLDIFLPAGPKHPLDLVRFYTYRRTGRRPIGTPFYLSQAGLATSTDSPTGPGQVDLAPLAIVDLILDGMDSPGNPDCALLVDCALRRMGVPLPAEWEDLEGRWIDYLHGGIRVFGPFPDMVSLLTEEIEFTAQEIGCILKAFRCWQIEGSVYRGMMVELPRLVAEIWLEEEMQLPPAPALDRTYHARLITHPRRSRKVFEERLETMLPTADRMELQTNGPGGAVPGGGPCLDRWAIDNGKMTDVIITNVGIFFPPIPDRGTAYGPVAGSGASSLSDQLNSLLAEIACGRAGNPVFTDSQRCEGEE